MQITTRASYGVMVVDLVGEFDSYTSGDIDDDFVKLVKDGDKKLINMEKVEYVSSEELLTILIPAKLIEHEQYI